MWPWKPNTNKGSIHQTASCVFPKHSPLRDNSKGSFFTYCFTMFSRGLWNHKWPESQNAHVCSATAHVRVSSFGNRLAHWYSVVHWQHLVLIVERLHTRVNLYLHLFRWKSRFSKTKVNFHKTKQNTKRKRSLATSCYMHSSPVPRRWFPLAWNMECVSCLILGNWRE